MKIGKQKRVTISIVWAVFATLFGLMTLKEGASTLFVDGVARAEAGNYVPFVLIFNFSAGFFYILAGLGLLKKKKWAVSLAGTIGGLSALVFAGFGFHILSGGLYEPRTVVAMTIRTTFWIVTFVYFRIQQKKEQMKGRDRVKI